jgi:hypothetical protein
MTDRRRKITEALTGTMKIDPDQYSYRTSPDRLNSLSYALAGWLYMLRRQKNTRIQAVASIIVMLTALWLEIDFLSFAILILTITIVWMAEFINRNFTRWRRSARMWLRRRCCWAWWLQC